MDNMDFDERLNDLKDEEKTESIEFKETKSDMGHSLFMEQSEQKRSSFGSWFDIRRKMGENFERHGFIVGALKSLGMIALNVLSLPVTLIKYALTREARPYDYEGQLNKMKAKDDLMEHYNNAKNKKNNPEVKREEEKIKGIEVPNNGEVTNDKIRITNAINSLRGQTVIKNNKGENVSSKTIAGVMYVGYSPKTESLLFYKKGGKPDEIRIDSNELKSKELVGKISEIFKKRDIQNYRDNSNIGLSADTPINPVLEKSIGLSAVIKAGMYVAAINASLNKDMQNEGTVLSTSEYEGKEVKFKANGKEGIEILVAGEIKDTIKLSDIYEIKDAKADEIAVNTELISLGETETNIDSAHTDMEHMNELDDFDSIKDTIIENPNFDSEFLDSINEAIKAGKGDTEQDKQYDNYDVEVDIDINDNNSVDGQDGQDNDEPEL